MDSLHVNDVADDIPDDEDSIEAIRAESVSLEVMQFEAGDEDPMHAHREDEIYVVDSGAGKINVDGDTTEVSEGDVIHLEPGTDHQFLDFEDELVMTVLYAPAKGSNE
ncbi:cupin domain-containing protein [Halorientalis sp.]|jgi:quercetin dioxygenase-like cupin family protein|uniref:cupin domain-containing protein n=1 Tax=Halorientalis sp. TaxID=1931229 RepID=UPI002611EC19|nr:cupin domain-containing protein [Halorientalis sp.]